MRGAVLTPVAVALGSNVGDRATLLHRAVRLLANRGVLEPQSLVTSSLYETAPLYVSDQPRFLNAALRANTSLSPRELLRALKAVESDLGRDFAGLRYGPRPIDLDVIFYGDATLSLPEVDDAPGGGAFTIPHPRFHERGFVLAPLDDLLPWRATTRPPSPDATALGLAPPAAAADTDGLDARLHDARAKYRRGGFAHGPDLRRVFALPVPVGAGDALVWPLGVRTYVMGVLNVTPDSFSDGGVHEAADAALSQAHAMARDGADIVDVGGQSTRPGAATLDAEQEWERVAPVLDALMRDPPCLRDDHPFTPGAPVPISVDTFHGTVAERAASLGCALLNDVAGGVPWGWRTGETSATLHDSPAHTAGACDDRPLAYALMHMRGTPATMQNDEMLRYPGDDVAGGVGDELAMLCRHAMQRHGVEAWRLVLDPGIGFAKTGQGNWDIIRNIARIRSRLPYGALRNAPFLLGPSRKGFLGALTGRLAPERDVATAAAIAACVQGGADIVRAHNVAAARDACLVADRVWRAP